MSYQSVNGTRQTPRNFKEGTLEIGKMHFTNTQDRITKEMIMDHQKTEQEKHYVDSPDNKLLYEPTGLTDIIDVYKPIDCGLLGKSTTKDDVQDYEDDFLQLHYDLKTLKNDAQTKDVEISDKRTVIFTKGEDVQNKKDEHTKDQNHWFELNTELTDVQKKIVKMEAVLPVVVTVTTAGLPPLSPGPGSTQENLNNGKKKKGDRR